MPTGTGKPRPGRRSNHGQKILISIYVDPELGSDLVFCVELRGFEPRTSCMPWNAGSFTTVHGRPPETALSCEFVHDRPPPFTTVHCGR
jgi:hypothetical protein